MYKLFINFYLKGINVNHFSKLVLMLCSILFSTASIAGLPINNLPDAQRLAVYLSSINNLEANYVQHTHDGNNDLLQTQKGKMFLTRPNKFKWISEAPYEQVLVSNGETLWQYDPDLEQVTVQKLDGRLSSTPVLLLSGDAEMVSEEYEVYGETIQDEQHFVLIPKRNDALFDRLRLEFNSAKQMFRMVIKDEIGQKTVINLSNQKTIIGIAENFYEFVIPEGIDVIESQ
ncbi:MAG: outer membrane lipoprotein carrier protein [Crocinitomicaceae bacterium]